MWSSWFNGVGDHTKGDYKDYMIVINAKSTSDIIFKTTINNLCIGTRYELSLYGANLNRAGTNYDKPNVSFRIQSAMYPNITLAEKTSDYMNEYNTFTWIEY